MASKSRRAVDDTPLSDALLRIVNLDQDLHEHSAGERSVARTIADLRERRSTLAGRLAALAAEEPAPGTDLQDAAIDALAADPGASFDSAAVADGVASFRVAHDAWQTKVSLVEQAMGKLDADIAATEAQRTQGYRANAEAWGAFVQASHSYLLDEFRQRFGVLRHEVLEPLLALASEKDGSGKPIVRGDLAPQLQIGEVNIIQRMREGDGHNTIEERLFPLVHGERFYSPETPIPRDATARPSWSVELRRLADQIGVHEALTLCDQLGACDIEVPENPDDADFAEIIGPEATVKLCAAYGGNTFSVPPADYALYRARRSAATHSAGSPIERFRDSLPSPDGTPAN